jgi:hypothetical protein
MESIGVQVGVALAVLLLLERLANAAGWRGVHVGGLPVVSWLVITAMALWLEAVAAFVLVHGLLFAFGAGVAGAALVLVGMLLIATPFVTAALLHRRASTSAARR